VKISAPLTNWYFKIRARWPPQKEPVGYRKVPTTRMFSFRPGEEKFGANNSGIMAAFCGAALTMEKQGASRGQQGEGACLGHGNIAE